MNISFISAEVRDSTTAVRKIKSKSISKYVICNIRKNGSIDIPDYMEKPLFLSRDVIKFKTFNCH